MSILQIHPKPHVTFEEAQVSGRLVEYKSAGVTYPYTPKRKDRKLGEDKTHKIVSRRTVHLVGSLEAQSGVPA